ncbi:hypothetical protein ACWECR_27215 [Streptomyces sp. NPDC005056]
MEEHDDAQVVFETLNSRGTPLEHADLIKNLARCRGPGARRRPATPPPCRPCR